MSRWKEILKSLLLPSAWIRNHPASSELSDFIATRLDSGEMPEIIDSYEIRIGGLRLWCANYPYAYATIRSKIGGSSLFMPTRSVVRRLRAAEMEVRGLTGSAVGRAIAEAKGEA